MHLLAAGFAPRPLRSAPTTSFYAVSDDIRGVLRYARENLALRLFEQHSADDEHLREFASIDDSIDALDLGVDPWSAENPAVSRSGLRGSDR